MAGLTEWLRQRIENAYDTYHDSFKTSVQKIEDEYGFEVENTPMGEMRVVSPFRLVGATFGGTTVDSNFWTATVDATAGPGTITQANGEITLNSGTNAAAYSKLNSNRRGRYVSGSSNRFRAIVQLGDIGTANNIRKWGIAYGATMPTITDGAYFQLSGTTFSIVTLKGSTPTVISSGSFNGDLGSSYTLTTNATTYEIYWTNSRVFFTIGGSILHTVTASTTTWADTVSHHVYIDNVNSGAQASDRVIKCRVASIARLGPLETAPMWIRIASAVTTQVLKRGPGRLHHVCFNTIPNTTIITLYDSIGTASGTICVMNPPNGATPFNMNFDLDFYNGLSVTTTPANVDLTIVYE